jgi:hypothetical protein
MPRLEHNCNRKLLSHLHESEGEIAVKCPVALLAVQLIKTVADALARWKDLLA